MKQMDALEVAATSIDRADLRGEYLRVASDYAAIGQRLAQATFDAEVASSEVKISEAQARDALRAQWEAGGVKITETALTAAVPDHKIVRTARESAADAQAERVRLQTILEAVRMKRDMLVSLAADSRREIDAFDGAR